MTVTIKCAGCREPVEVGIDTEGGTIIAVDDGNLYECLKLVTMESDGSQYIEVKCQICRKLIG